MSKILDDAPAGRSDTRQRLICERARSSMEKREETLHLYFPRTINRGTRLVDCKPLMVLSEQGPETLKHT